MIDDDDVPLIQGRTWYLDITGYAQSETKDRVRLHRLLMQPPPGYEVDHINGNRVDCRRANMLIVTHAENTQRVRTKKGRYRGVYLDKRKGTWYGQVKHNGVRVSAGWSKDREVAREAAERLRRELGFPS